MQKRLGTIATGVLLGLIAAAPAASGDREGGPSCGGVTVRVWNTLPAEAEAVRAAKAVVERIFWRSGIDIRWIDCALDDPTCPSPTGPTEVSLRIYRRPEATRRANYSTGGAALTGEGGARIVHLHYERLEELSGHGVVPLELAVGLTAAHEIGHLLLARGHSLAGIMRPTFEAPEWHLARQRWLLFTSQESKLLKYALCGPRPAVREK
jgi:hypothetical protein